ncbi:MAG: hypothetical protein Q4C01_04540 [Clostridia bacterium]|nr:hypothetical protein [Clostridia bacterium]
MRTCKSCNAPIGDGDIFCSACGQRQAERRSQVFGRKNLREAEFIAKINEWFAMYPQVANVTCEFDLGYGLGALVNRRVLNALAIQYETLSGTNLYQYGLVHLQNFGLVQKDLDKMLKQWQQANPEAVVIKTVGGVCQRGDPLSLALGGVMATNRMQLYVFFKFNRQTGTAEKCKS